MSYELVKVITAASFRPDLFFILPKLLKIVVFGVECVTMIKKWDLFCNFPQKNQTEKEKANGLWVNHTRPHHHNLSNKEILGGGPPSFH